MGKYGTERWIGAVALRRGRRRHALPGAALRRSREILAKRNRPGEFAARPRPKFCCGHRCRRLQCLGSGGDCAAEIGRTVACLALAGASEPDHLAAAQNHKHPFGKPVDHRCACRLYRRSWQQRWRCYRRRHRHGRLGGRERKTYRVGGWGLPLSDEGSGAWIGCEALRRVLWALDGRLTWTPLLQRVVCRFCRRSARDRGLGGNRVATRIRFVRDPHRRSCRAW